MSDRWNASIIHRNANDIRIQIAGLQRNGHTCFIRVLERNQTHILTLKSLMLEVQSIIKERHTTSTSFSVENRDAILDLIHIGSVWIISSCNQMRPRRANMDELNRIIDDSIIVRIHYGATRFYNVYNYDWGSFEHQSSGSRKGVILYEDENIGFAIINKPSGVPVHGYVYNSVENVVHMYEASLLERRTHHKTKLKISVPQRLDTETSGVLIIATKSTFASYMGKLFEDKTISHAKLVSPSNHPSVTLKKRYKVLVCMKSKTDIDYLENNADSNRIISHFLSPERSEPRKFLKIDTGEGEKCLECHLRITSVGFDDFKVIDIQGSKEASEIAGKLWGFDCSRVSTSIPFRAITQLEVELLTGRTHQIRGQLSDLGYPLVGDCLYGGDLSFAKNDKLGLHCSMITFPKPVLVVDDYTKINKNTHKIVQLHASDDEILTFRSDSTWWNKYIK